MLNLRRTAAATVSLLAIVAAATFTSERLWHAPQHQARRRIG